MFRVGQKVVCVEGGAHGSSECEDAIVPAVGSIYPIRDIRTNPRTGEPNFHLHEIRNGLVLSVVDGLGEPYFASTRFRPIVSRPTSIEFAHEILRSVSAPTKEPAHV